MFASISGATPAIPTITTTTPPPMPAATMQGASATSMPGAVANDSASQRHNANANGYRTLERTHSVANLPNDVKSAGSDRD